ncbi:protein SPMIP1-like [Parasteatoda tepidariorum]|uniref:protein SPMIP1-like n=1 Tax=Parasteatoda tepidariorum TaxID=114398 RepID=UPI001C71D02A|nr:protein ATP6V1FNB-like [Parasteatoda tepidariorum]
MARDKMFDPAFQKAFTEAIHKETDVRMKWNLKYGSRFRRSDAVKWDEDPDGDDDEEQVSDDSERKKLTSKLPPTKEERAWPATKPPVSTTIPRVNQPPRVMKPVSPQCRKLIYQGISHDGEGRRMYLNQRYRERPMERYYYPIVNSWEYGWDYKQYECEDCSRNKNAK